MISFIIGTFVGGMIGICIGCYINFKQYRE